MDYQSLLSQFGIEPDQRINIGRYDAVYSKGIVYIMVPIEDREQNELIELHKLSNHLYAYGDQTIARFKQNKNQSYIGRIQDQSFVVLYNEHLRSINTSQIGRSLAEFHYRGKLFNEKVQVISRIGQWKELWEKRLDQMDQVWQKKLFAEPEEEFDRLFIESFPYFMGLAENAIQYLVDTELDDNPNAADAGTVCYQRFSRYLWEGDVCIKNPFDWVFDHAGRDIAEWVREHVQYHYRTYENGIRAFFREYQSLIPLSSFSWRLIFARLTFPLHYFEIVEDYYLSHSEHNKKLSEDRLNTLISRTSDYEEFIGRFYELAGAPVRSFNLPGLGWV
ncbi:MAG TPA: spore coat protein YutH [Bacillus sp. (in: firmicutes)]|uniref:spore coat putative kinase YutH n=1 Tax=Bacillus litorisediminis TaxID=2922713 RepID=UPI001FAB8801|nr:spore coat protein YutH [Bacillus litorisediminis]HWO77174.1 spore coat protein YutH [Bacillus sp. (in: firmicutes)]